MKSLIIGKGEVGSALYTVLSVVHETFIKDIEPLELDGVEVLNICYPDHDGFEKTTKDYQDQYKPKVTIIHSSVKVGTTDKCQGPIVYSPVRGRHPKLASDLLIYPKFIFGKGEISVQLACRYLSDAGMKIQFGDDPKEGELLKLISNIHMGLEIAWRQEVEKVFDKLGIRNESYEEWEKTYSSGYMDSGDFNLIRPIMRSDPIGGHCILPCTKILNDQVPSPFFKLILESKGVANVVNV